MESREIRARADRRIFVAQGTKKGAPTEGGALFLVCAGSLSVPPAYWAGVAAGAGLEPDLVAGVVAFGWAAAPVWVP